MSVHDTNSTNGSSGSSESNDQPVVGLPGDERDVLISRVIDGVASSEDWKIFRAVAAHDPSIWSELADTQQMDESVRASVHHVIDIADRIELPGGMIDDRTMRTRLDLVSRWGGWAAAAAILLVWFFGNPVGVQSEDAQDSNIAGLPLFGNGTTLLNDAQPEQALSQYLQAGQQSGRVVGEMPEQIVIETRPMPDGTIEVLYLRQIIERQILDHAYRELHNEAGQTISVPVKLSPSADRAY